MKSILFVGLGSFLGGVSRYLISTVIRNKADSIFPYHTLLVNLLGCFFIGCLYSYFTKGNISDEWKLFLLTGLLGGFTTFSAFSLEFVQLMKSGANGTALLYVTLSVIGGITLTLLGMWVTTFAQGN